MTDIVTSATIHANLQHATDKETIWTVTFTNNETRSGTLMSIGNSDYVLNKGDRAYYFSAAQVVYLYPSVD
jgi:hypothetical protein